MEQESYSENPREAALAEARELRRLVYRDPASYGRLVAHLEELKERHPDFDDYQMYHLVIGSSEERPEKLDFPGEDSLLSWLRREVTKS